MLPHIRDSSSEKPVSLAKKNRPRQTPYLPALMRTVGREPIAGRPDYFRPRRRMIARAPKASSDSVAGSGVAVMVTSA